MAQKTRMKKSEEMKRERKGARTKNYTKQKLMLY
jgi:hypothetical protein